MVGMYGETKCNHLATITRIQEKGVLDDLHKGI